MITYQRGICAVLGGQSQLLHPGRNLASVLSTASSESLTLEQAIQLLAQAHLERVSANLLLHSPCLEKAVIAVST